MEEEKKGIKISFIITLTIIVITLIGFGIFFIKKVNNAENTITGELAEDNKLSNKNIGDKINYSVTVNGIKLNNWRLFYYNDDEVYVIYEGYLPNSTNIASKVGLTQGEDVYSKYGVYSDINKNYFLNKLNAVREKDLWNDLLTPELKKAGATAKGGIDIETWVKSWNAKGYVELAINKMEFSDGTAGYSVLKEDNTNTSISGMLNISSDADGYGDSLYFPVVHDEKNVENPYYGYWIASPSSIADGYLMIATDDGNLGDNLHGYSNAQGVGIRPIINIPSKILQKSKLKEHTWDIKY